MMGGFKTIKPTLPLNTKVGFAFSSLEIYAGYDGCSCATKLDLQIFASLFNCPKQLLNNLHYYNHRGSIKQQVFVTHFYAILYKFLCAHA